MKMILQSERLEDYLAASEDVDYQHPAVTAVRDRLAEATSDEVERIKLAFEFVRDEIAHSWDIQSHLITRKASEALLDGEGICYAKSNLLAALLRALGIPAGFCYQRLTLGDTPDTGYCLHALNGVYVSSLQKWIRLDARGNKPGIEAEFSLEEEKLAFPIRCDYDEIDYPIIYFEPNKKTMDCLRAHADCRDMYRNGLPTEL
ncbi:transglutaminase-like domain-containing protein [Paenibacillus sp. MBLB4367]|uniref:transglutaminase-like domain-containing protein n=1 Tax=Paenibacillus sp. MBLB4367 TaxID=3384767 RepID=UPI0039080721